ncbi:lyase family protein [Streptomyces roseolus]|uniref:lyase family protein n=1 Tax=Streptomyces roseolus TaxID=67358 RepID=UPI0016746E7D|nr:lyase family protein [Streptomyces roseolus]GGR54165.1 hypothetical protein GCM10010282_54170 [Streptomyces roseolus]
MATCSTICNDLRLLASGPRAGLGEIRLPELQAGSSIMPGKGNPVVPKRSTRSGSTSWGAAAAVCAAAQSGQLQLNAACVLLAERCVGGARRRGASSRTRGEQRGSRHALNPVVGHQRATALARECRTTGVPVREPAARDGLVPEEEIASLLAPWRLARPR